MSRLSAVNVITQIPLGIAHQIRADAAHLVRDPKLYTYHGACGGGAPNPQTSFAQETPIGRFEE